MGAGPGLRHVGASSAGAVHIRGRRGRGRAGRTAGPCRVRGRPLPELDLQRRVDRRAAVRGAHVHRLPPGLHLRLAGRSHRGRRGRLDALPACRAHVPPEHAAPAVH